LEIPLAAAAGRAAREIMPVTHAMPVGDAQVTPPSSQLRLLRTYDLDWRWPCR
jgi:hypothetical protein